MTGDLAAFLAARLDEDEAAAKALASRDWGNRPWAVTECSDKAAGECPCIVYQGEYGPLDEPQTPLIEYVADTEAPEYAAHIARHDPARALREVAAKRAILAEHPPVPMRGIEASSCRLCRLPWPCPTVRALIAVYDS
jgi:hypothetical protein